jgi:hypothetical protein
MGGVVHEYRFPDRLHQPCLLSDSQPTRPNNFLTQGRRFTPSALNSFTGDCRD